MNLSDQYKMFFDTYYNKHCFANVQLRTKEALEIIMSMPNTPQRKLVETCLYEFAYSDPVFGLGLIIVRSKEKVTKYLTDEQYKSWADFVDLMTRIDVEYRRNGNFN